MLIDCDPWTYSKNQEVKVGLTQANAMISNEWWKEQQEMRSLSHTQFWQKFRESRGITTTWIARGQKSGQIRTSGHYRAKIVFFW